ncbi:MAG: hypothetical protein LBF40_05945 [Deltaproteobacteria bacterium]|nr:hypothetical protein [Deltaproteobacteria bacterium]
MRLCYTLFVICAVIVAFIPKTLDAQTSDQPGAYSDIEKVRIFSPIYSDGIRNYPIINIYDLMQAAVNIGSEEGIIVNIFPAGSTNAGTPGSNRYISFTHDAYVYGFEVIEPQNSSNNVTFSFKCTFNSKEYNILEPEDGFGPSCEKIQVTENGANVPEATAFKSNRIFQRAFRDAKTSNWNMAG